MLYELNFLFSFPNTLWTYFRSTDLILTSVFNSVKILDYGCAIIYSTITLLPIFCYPFSFLTNIITNTLQYYHRFTILSFRSSLFLQICFKKFSLFYFDFYSSEIEHLVLHLISSLDLLFSTSHVYFCPFI